MTGANRRNFLWPLLVIGTGVLMLLVALEVLPSAVADLVGRSWGIIFVIAGLNMLLIDRVRFGNWLALGLSVPLLAVIIYSAFIAQEDTVRDDYREALDPLFLGENIETLTVSVQTLDTSVLFRAAPNADRILSATFTGSTESNVRMTAQENDPGQVDFTVVETRPNAIPDLGALGRGNLQVALPGGITIQNLLFQNENGGATLDFSQLDVPRFEVRNVAGDVDLFMPQRGIVFADISLADGNLRLFVDPTIPLDIRNIPGSVEADPNTYLLLRDSLESRGLGQGDAQFVISVDIPNGNLTILPPEEN